MSDGSRSRTPNFVLLAAWMAIALTALPQARAQEPAAPQEVGAAQLKTAIDRLGELDYGRRTEAAKIIRRAPAAQVVPVLLDAVASHQDEYVKYRALVLLTGFNDSRTRRAMVDALGSRNDRLRAVAFNFFERNDAADVLPRLVTALDSESSEFVRPALIRAVTAHAESDALRAQMVREASRGEDFFRSVVIEALGDYKAVYAVDALLGIVKLDGPLTDDAALALGKIRSVKAQPVMAELRSSAPTSVQPSIAAALCLLGADCAADEAFLSETLAYATKERRQELLRSTASALGSLGTAGRDSAVDLLFRAGVASTDPARAPIALALGTVALRNTPLMLSYLGTSGDPSRMALLAEGFEMLDEDLEKERFFAGVRRAYWAAAENSPTRALMRTLIEQLDF